MAELQFDPLVGHDAQHDWAGIKRGLLSLPESIDLVSAANAYASRRGDILVPENAP
jgi:hypothetical protein